MQVEMAEIAISVSRNPRVKMNGFNCPGTCGKKGMRYQDQALYLNSLCHVSLMAFSKMEVAEQVSFKIKRTVRKDVWLELATN